jgi:hypothetical protein
MTAAAILDRLRAAGVHVVVDLALEAASEPPADLLAELEVHKAEAVALLAAAGVTGAELAAAAPPLAAPAAKLDGERDALMERAAIPEHERGRRLPAPLVLRDGRRLWRIAAGRGGQATEAAAALVAEAKRARVVTVADNTVLLICVAAGYRGDLPERLAAARADVLAVLHRQSDERIAAQLSWRPEA